MLTFKQYVEMASVAVTNLNIPAEPSGLYDPVRYMLDGGGKRLRPSLTLAVADAYGLSPLEAINQAMGVEMFHNFTLLHDDVMDRADMRHGRPTVHCRWDERTAILSGDAMLTLASMLVESAPEACREESLRLFNRTAIDVYEGQQLDMDFETDASVTVDRYMHMIYLKTSVLLGCACAMGALAAGASAEAVDAIYSYGANLGVAFQLQDDLLDTFGDPAVFGKTIGGDILCDKQTWLRIRAIAADTTGTMSSPELAALSPAEKIARVTEVYCRLRLPEACRELIDTYTERAVADLDRAGLGDEAREWFAALAREISLRSK